MKIWFRRIAAAGLLFFPFSACALDIAYGSFFTIRGVTQKDGRPILPVTRGQYANVRILDQETFAWLAACKAARCTQEDTGGQIEVTALRGAKTRKDMWIADVAIDSRWLLTFLVFQNLQGYRIVVPEVIRIEKAAWLQQLKQQISAAIDRLKAEGEDDV